MTAMRAVVSEAARQGYPRDRIVASHQDLGIAEWPGTRQLVELHAKIYGLRLEVSRYKNAAGENPSLLDYVLKRGKWPSNNQRWCTSEYKRGPGNRVITALSRERKGDVLQVFGFRSAESPNRAKKKPFEPNPRASCGFRTVTDWHPILHWQDRDVWSDIHESGIPYHYCYDLGMPRHSCVFCIFAPPAALAIAALHNPHLATLYVDVERKTGHTFRHEESLESIVERAHELVAAGGLDGNWDM